MPARQPAPTRMEQRRRIPPEFASVRTNPPFTSYLRITWLMVTISMAVASDTEYTYSKTSPAHAFVLLS
jgi:hypothetical protein